MFCALSDKFSDLRRIFCTSIKIKPNPNSTADNIKKKKVKESKFKLSKISPITKEAAYKVIHSNSAVNSKWRAVLIFITILAIKKKKINNIIFKSPILIVYKIIIVFTKYSKARNFELVEVVDVLSTKILVKLKLAKFNWSAEMLDNPELPTKISCRIYTIVR